MDRRTFLQASGAAVVMLSAPSLALSSAEKKPETVEELIAWMESYHQCEMGMPCAWGIRNFPENKWAEYFEAVNQPNHDDHPVVKLCGEMEMKYGRYMYETYAIACEDGPDAEAKLVRYFYDTWKHGPGGDKLYWRLQDKISFVQYETQEYLDKPVLTPEAHEDFRHLFKQAGYFYKGSPDFSGVNRQKYRAAGNIEIGLRPYVGSLKRVDFTKLDFENLVLDFDTGCFYEPCDVVTHKRARLRTRLAVATTTPENQPMHHTGGTPIKVLA